MPLFVVTGPSGAGKTTITPLLRGLLPECDVFEGDLTLHAAAAGYDHWRNTWLQIAHGVALNGRAAVLSGSLLPDQLEGLPARKLVGPIHFCTLDCPDDIIAARLRARPAWRGASSETVIAQHQEFGAWLRTHISPCFDTASVSPGEVAERVAAWVRGALTSPR